MRHRQITAFGLLLALGVAVMVPAVALSDPGTAASVQNSSDNETEAGLGTQITSFAQATAVDADGGVDRGLWEGRANGTDENRTDELITDRTAALDSRLTALQNRTERLNQNRENISEAAYNARASVLRSQVANVRAAIEQANQTAADRGVDIEQLDRLQENTTNLTGPEVAATARNITDAPQGPSEELPSDAGPGEDGPGRADNRGARTGPGENGTNGAGERGNDVAQAPGEGVPGNKTTDETPGSDRSNEQDRNGSNAAGEQPDSGNSTRADGGETGSSGADTGNSRGTDRPPNNASK